MRHPSTLSVQLTPALTSHSHFLIKVNSSIQTTQSLTISTIFKDQCISITNRFMIFSVILLTSGPFCVTTPTICYKLFDHWIQHHHHYALSYAIDSLSTSFLPCVCLWSWPLTNRVSHCNIWLVRSLSLLTLQSV